MTDGPRTWNLDRTTPVREDAEGLFVRVADVPAAAIGDLVELRGPDGTDARTGMIVEQTEHDGRAYFRLDLGA